MEIGDGDPYVQGSGDDTENWAHSLTPDLFWHFKDELSPGQSEDKLKETIDRIKNEAGNSAIDPATLINWTSHSVCLFIGHLKAVTGASRSELDAFIFCNEKAFATQESDIELQTHPPILRLGCRTGKLGSRDLRTQFPRVSRFTRQLHSHARVLVSCRTGNDLAVGVALSLLCQFYDDDGRHELS